MKMFHILNCDMIKRIELHGSMKINSLSIIYISWGWFEIMQKNPC